MVSKHVQTVLQWSALKLRELGYVVTLPWWVSESLGSIPTQNQNQIREKSWTKEMVRQAKVPAAQPGTRGVWRRSNIHKLSSDMHSQFVSLTRTCVYTHTHFVKFWSFFPPAEIMGCQWRILHYLAKIYFVYSWAVCNPDLEVDSLVMIFWKASCVQLLLSWCSWCYGEGQPL